MPNRDLKSGWGNDQVALMLASLRPGVQPGGEGEAQAYCGEHRTGFGLHVGCELSSGRVDKTR